MVTSSRTIMLCPEPWRQEYKAKVIGTDPRTDIAVLKIEATGLPTLTVGDSSKLKVGDLVFAIGDPFPILLLIDRSGVTHFVVVEPQ
jgi:S1-C subfamily serine protease